MTLLAVPNVSEGRDSDVISAVRDGFESQPEVRLLDVHSDPDHNRSVFTLAGRPATLSRALLHGAREAVQRIDIRRHEGVHPRTGALDVAPIVHLREADVGPACAEALVLGDLLGEELDLPVFLYGRLAGGRTRADLRRGGPDTLSERIATGELRPDFGPSRLHPTAGAVLVGARPPLVAFNVELAPSATLADARAIAAAIREGGAVGLPGLRAIGVWLSRRGVAQVSMNVEDPAAAALARIVDAIARQAPPARAEIVGLVPRSALERFPQDLPLSGGITIEDALSGHAGLAG